MTKTRIYFDEKGLSYSSPFKKFFIPWTDIVKIENKYISPFSPGKYGGPPQDLIIKTKNKITLKVFSFIKTLDQQNDENGIQAFKTELKKYVEDINIG